LTSRLRITAAAIRKCLDSAWSCNSNRKIRASDEWLEMTTALTVPLSGGKESTQYSFLVRPLFGRPEDPAKQTDVFVLMPFAQDRKALYEDHIVPPMTARPIMSDIWAALFGCGVIVADCTGRNPNVFYEIGVAHAIGKPVILITENEDDVPADLRHIRYIAFEFTPRGMAQFERQLQQTVYACLGMYEAWGDPPRFDGQ